MKVLYVGKDGKLSVRCGDDDNFMEHLKMYPGTRQKPKNTIIWFDQCIASVRILKELSFEYSFHFTPDAASLLEKIKKEYKDKRRLIKKSEIQFKRKSGTIAVPIKTTPYEHQVRAFGFCSLVNYNALLMEQGTGKTMVAICLMGYRSLKQGVKRILVVCPKPVIPVWPRELEKHAAFDYQLTAQYKFKVPDATEGLSIWVTNYEKIKNNEKAIKKWNPEYIILDESHKIKNRGAKRSKAITRVGRVCDYRTVLTGTPLGQSPLDIFSQYLFLDPDVFGSNWNIFTNRYAKMGGFKGYKVIGHKNLDELSKKVHSIAFRVTKEECLDLPDKIYQNLYCEPGAESKRVYKEMEEEFSTVVQGEEVEVDLVISQMMKLRQVTGGILRGEDDRLLSVAQDKLGTLRDYIESRDTDRKLVIFVSFTHEISFIGDMLCDMGIEFLTLSGATPGEERNKLEETFRQESRYGIVIIQASTGAEGLDFTAADTAIFYSPFFSFIQYEQACARIHRIGQTRTCYYINLVMEGTIDEHIVELIKSHSSVSKKLLDKDRDYRLTKTGKKKLDKAEDKQLDDALQEIENEIKTNGKPTEVPKKMAKKKIEEAEVEETTKTKRKSKKSDADKPSKKKAKSADAKPTATAGYNAKDLAEELGIEPAELRKYLRKTGAEKPGKSWVWPKKTDSALKEIKANVKQAIKDDAAKGKTKDKPKLVKKGDAPSKAAKKKVAKKRKAEDSE